MQRCAFRVPKGNGVAKSGDRKLGCHSRIDRVAHDPVRADVFDRAKIELAFVGPMFRNINQPQLVESVGGEVAEHEIIMDGRALTRDRGHDVDWVYAASASLAVVAVS